MEGLRHKTDQVVLKRERLEGPGARAAKYGHLAVLQWARQHGCPWNEVGPGIYCLSRHPTHFDPLLLELHGIL